MQANGEVVVMEGGKYSRSTVKHLTLISSTGETQVFREFSGKLIVDTASESLSLMLQPQQKALWSDLLLVLLAAVNAILVYRAWFLR